MSRPENLPDFSNPPLKEVVLGIQFAPPSAYKPIHAGEVWHLFESNFPTTRELETLPASYELFGLPQCESPQAPSFEPVPGKRFWFLSPEENELIQFQQDRLLHNWRKEGNFISILNTFRKVGVLLVYCN